MRMKFEISLALAICMASFAMPAQGQSPMREQALKTAALRDGVTPLSDIQPDINSDLVAVGAKLFESSLLSLNGETSCQTCHLDKFSSADGLPNAIGTSGVGEGHQRLMSKGDIVPRNALALWGRGSKGFGTFFWDGKVEQLGNDIRSQFGTDLPSKDPLVVAVHLPFVEIREMVRREEEVIERYETEDTTSAEAIYNILVERLKQDGLLSNQLSKAHGIEVQDIKFIHIAEAIANFIRSKFAVKNTRFNDFLFENGKMSEEQVEGGLIFFGKGQCSTCHNGPLMSDLKFYVMPVQQLGFGKNGFGVDYGRFNATKDPDDIYKFRTPPLINVTKTAPYSHSGAYETLEETIEAHVDPLKNYNGSERTALQRREDLTRIGRWSNQTTVGETLSKEEISLLVEYLGTLSTN